MHGSGLVGRSKRGTKDSVHLRKTVGGREGGRGNERAPHASYEYQSRFAKGA